MKRYNINQNSGVSISVVVNYFFHILGFILFSFTLHGQNQTPVLEKGTVSFVSSRNVYVKFSSTENINITDTLYINENQALVPALVVSNKSSTSTVCVPIFDKKLKVADVVTAKTIKIDKAAKEKEKEKEKEKQKEAAKEEKAAANKPVTPVITPDEDGEESLFKEKVNGRISVASYSNLSDYKDTHRMRYALFYRANHFKNSKFSIDNYITFRHTLGEWQDVKDNFSQALKVYSLAVTYDFDSTSTLTLGRKINGKISSIGAIDGLQYEKTLGRITLGAIAGSRPDYSDYGLNLNLLQVGAYASLISRKANSYQQTTFGFMEQRNKANVDRRFVYFQHSGDLLKNLNLFGSFEFDLYQKLNNETKNTLQLTNLYLSLRYRLSKKWRLSVSYDNRKNIIYYESYKTYIDQLIEDETRQGLRFGVNYRPFKSVTWGVNTSWRFQKSDSNVSQNLNTYLNFSKIPFLKVRASITANFLQTNYLKSQIFGIRFSREIIKRKVNADLYFRMVDYHYTTSENRNQQKIAGTSFSLKLMKKLTLYGYYEGTFDNRNQVYHRFNTRLIQRF